MVSMYSYICSFVTTFSFLYLEACKKDVIIYKAINTQLIVKAVNTAIITFLDDATKIIIILV